MTVSIGRATRSLSRPIGSPVAWEGMWGPAQRVVVETPKRLTSPHFDSSQVALDR